MDYLYFVLFTAVGVFNILAAVFNWDWYFKSMARQRHFFHKGSRTVMRVGFAVLGILLVLFGVFIS
ncbi:MAG: immunity 17 family protein [Oscillospiraceae bacterium]|nr:immunity 17 family protein [Oscillospiraceae bacterium]